MSSMHSPAPVTLGEHIIQDSEFVYHMYMPIKMAQSDIRLPVHLKCYEPLVASVASMGDIRDKIMYLTVKRMYLKRGEDANRPGWHIDGYGSNDLNFVWSNAVPTEFAVGDFDLSLDHNISLIQMEQQAKDAKIVTFDNNTLLMLTNKMVHRVGVCREDCIRSFVKISLSNDIYNLRGNSHNYLFPYRWDMVDRQFIRNNPTASTK